jgi:serine/threonine protein kinase
MEMIKLPHGVWSYDPNQPLGPEGGFGIVYAGNSQEIGEIAVKKIKFGLEDAAHRELRFADILTKSNLEHVIPFYDAGQDAETGNYYVVMARADHSLHQELCAGKTFTETEAVEILLQITKGLIEVPDIAHRDLKPGNVLFHHEKWKVADFGIAKVIEESTSFQTLKDCLSPQYAAPEQWEYLHPTHAVDVYALGCIGYALLTGNPPFIGTTDELKQQHLNKEPPVLNIVNDRLRSLLGMMLRKIPETRPSLARVKHLLEEMQKSESQSTSGGLSLLSNAAAQVLDQSAKEEALRLQEHCEQVRREKIAEEAMKILIDITDYLLEKITIYAPNARPSQGYSTKPGQFYYPDRIITLGTAKLSINFSRFAKIPKDSFQNSKWDVYAGAIIEVKQDSIRPYEWGANLWYTDLGKKGELRWWEVTYMSILTSPSPDNQPFAVDDLSLADRAASHGMDIIQLGAKPKLVDDEAVDEFCDRWATLLAKAARGELQHPSRLPID